MKTARWYFDFVSPFAYLQSRMMHRVAAHAAIEPVPVLFAALLDHWRTVGPAELAPKRVFTYRFCQWFAQRHGIPFRMPPRHPFSPLKPLRLALLLGSTNDAIQRIFDAIWAEGRDLETPESWSSLCAELGRPDPDAALDGDAVKAALRANTNEAIARGVWGVPTLAIDGELFWGVDATDLVADYLVGAVDFSADEYARIAALPSGGERRRPA